MLFARSSVVTHAKAFGLNAIDLVRTSYKGPEAVEGLKEEAEEGRRLGFDGKVSFHLSMEYLSCSADVHVPPMIASYSSSPGSHHPGCFYSVRTG